MNLLKKGIAECLGTLVLVFIACGVGALFGGANLVATALAFGLSVIAMAYAIGKISGCHINPAVSVAMLINKRITLKEFIVYIVFQFIGAILGAALLYAVFKQFTFRGSEIINVTGLGTNSFGIQEDGSGITLLGALILETVLTFIFCYTVLGVTSEEKNSSVAGLVIGFTLTVVHLLGITFTGTSVNPARSFGPAVVNAIAQNGMKPLAQSWLFIVAPILGAVIAGLVFKFLNTVKEGKK